MFKRLLLITTSCVLILSLTACGNYIIIEDNSPSVSSNTADPFAAIEENGFLATVSHGASNPNRAEDQSKLPFEYNGGEFSFDYEYSVTGKLDTVGFLLFLDGKPQPYRTEENGGYEYCHTFPAKETGTFALSFYPQQGKAGETLDLCIVSITNPDFRPDMKEISSYGWYHKSLEYWAELHFNENASTATPLQTKAADVFSNVTVREEKITSSYIEMLRQNGWDGVTMDDLDQSIYYTADFNSNIVYDNFFLSDSDKVIFRYTLCGTPGAEYDISFFIDHQPAYLKGELTYRTTLSKGNQWVFEIAFDTLKMDSFHTFYVMAVPKNSGNDVFSVLKSNSILLYKENG